MLTTDPVNSPAHYTRLSPEPIDVIESWNLPFHLANVLKYIARAGHKDAEVQDLRKAAWYLQRYIELRERECGEVGHSTPPQYGEPVGRFERVVDFEKHQPESLYDQACRVKL